MPSKVYNGLRKSFKKNEFMIITNYHICIKQILLFNKLQLLDIDSNLFNIETPDRGRGEGDSFQILFPQ